MTNQIFGLNKYYGQVEDTTKNARMQDFVLEEWGAPNFIKGEQELDGKKKASLRNSISLPASRDGKTGNVVPFFPKDWQKNANDVFNLIMNGQVPTEDAYDEVTHAAIHHKVQDSTSPFLQNVQKRAEKPVAGGRPTSGKHFAREHQFAKKKGDLAPPDTDP